MKDKEWIWTVVLPAATAFAFLAGIVIGAYVLFDSKTPPDLSPIPVSLCEELRREEWEDGVFWGAMAMVNGATNLNDAEVQAYRMRQESEENVRRKKRAIEKIEQSRKAVP